MQTLALDQAFEQCLRCFDPVVTIALSDECSLPFNPPITFGYVPFAIGKQL
jgi:hypothetical protein